jgi:hypothetical protein
MTAGCWPVTPVSLLRRGMGAHRVPPRLVPPGTPCARRASRAGTAARPRAASGHGRQAARSKRARPERAGEQGDELSHVRAAAGGALKP